MTYLEAALKSLRWEEMPEDWWGGVNGMPVCYPKYRKKWMEVIIVGKTGLMFDVGGTIPDAKVERLCSELRKIKKRLLTLLREPMKEQGLSAKNLKNDEKLLWRMANQDARGVQG